MIEHLNNVVADTENDMDLDNLARVFAPTLLRSPHGSVGDFNDSLHQIQVVKLLIQLPADYWNAAEITVDSTGTCICSSPVPEEKQLKRRRAVMKSISCIGGGLQI